MSDTENAFTPSTEQVRSHYVFDQTDRWDGARGEAFDRWLAAHDAEQREAGRLTALEEAGQQIIEALDTHYLVDDRNLGYYRTEVTCACGESWWYGEQDGDPRRWEMWDKHRVSVIAALRSSSPYRADQIGEQP